MFNNFIVYYPSDFAIFSSFYRTPQQTVQHDHRHNQLLQSTRTCRFRKETDHDLAKQANCTNKLTKALSFKIKFSSWTSPVNVNKYCFKNSRFKTRSKQKLVQLSQRSTHLPKSQFLAAMNQDSPSTGRQTYLEDRPRTTRTP